jgi:hypothetical protein
MQLQQAALDGAQAQVVGIAAVKHVQEAPLVFGLVFGARRASRAVSWWQTPGKLDDAITARASESCWMSEPMRSRKSSSVKVKGVPKGKGPGS